MRDTPDNSRNHQTPSPTSLDARAATPRSLADCADDVVDGADDPLAAHLLTARVTSNRNEKATSAYPFAINIEALKARSSSAVYLANKFVAECGRAGRRKRHMVAALSRRVRPERARHMAQCGAGLAFRFSPEIDWVRVHPTGACQNWVLCPVCSRVTQIESVQNYAHRLRGGVEHGFVLLEVSLTLPRGDPLPQTFGRFRRALRSLTRRFDPRRRGYGKLPVKGGVFRIEINFARGAGGWGVHAHGILIADKRLTHRDMLALWSDASHNSLPQVDVRTIRAGFHLEDRLWYCFKPPLGPEDDVITAWELLRGKHRVVSFGSIRGPANGLSWYGPWPRAEVVRLLRQSDGTYSLHPADSRFARVLDRGQSPGGGRADERHGIIGEDRQRVKPETVRGSELLFVRQTDGGYAHDPKTRAARGRGPWTGEQEL